MGVKEGDYLVRQLNHLLRQIGNPTLAGEIAESVQAINNQDTLPTLPEDSVRQPQSDNPSPSKGLEKFAEEDTLEGMLEEMPTHIKVEISQLKTFSFVVNLCCPSSVIQIHANVAMPCDF